MCAPPFVCPREHKGFYSAKDFVPGTFDAARGGLPPGDVMMGAFRRVGLSPITDPVEVAAEIERILDGMKRDV